MKKDDVFFMKKAIKLAQKALQNDEVPVGAVIVKDEKVISCAFNMKEKKQDSTAHAEILAIKKASKELGTWRLDNCTMYITLEPCVMCAGAITSARIKNVVYGASDNSGFLRGSTILSQPFLNHKVEYKSGILSEECEKLIKEFFKNKRKTNKTIDEGDNQINLLDSNI